MLAVVSPATRSAEVAVTRSAIDSRADANWSRFALSLRIDAEKSRTSTTSERSGAAARVGVMSTPADSVEATTNARKRRAARPGRFMASLVSRRSDFGVIVSLRRPQRVHIEGSLAAAHLHCPCVEAGRAE